MVRERLDADYLQLIFRANYLEDQLGAGAKGTTGYAAVRPAHLLSAKIPLPPLADQRRIAARVETLAARIGEAKQLRDAAADEIDRLLISMTHRLDISESEKLSAGWRSVTLAEVVRASGDPQSVGPDQTYPNFGIYSFARGLFPKPPIDGLSTRAKTLFRVKAGQFIYSRLFAFEGAYGIVTDEFDGHFTSNEYPTFDCDTAMIRPEFLASYFKAKHVWEEVARGSKGLGDRRQRVHPEQVLNHRLLLPPLDWQIRIAKTYAHRPRLATLQAETAKELDALLPAVLDRAFAGQF